MNFMPLHHLKSKPGKMITPPTKCEICDKDFNNARALVQHTQIVHGFKYDSRG